MKQTAKPILSPQNRITFLLLVGCLAIYTAIHFRNVYNKPQVEVLVNQSQVDFFNIPSLGIKAPIYYSESTDTNIQQSELDLGIVHVKNTPVPGQTGNGFYIGGSDPQRDKPDSYNDVFKNLQDIKPGDKIVITKNLKHYSYEVYQTRVAERTELWVNSQLTDGQTVLTLQSQLPQSKTKQKFVVWARLKD